MCVLSVRRETKVCVNNTHTVTPQYAFKQKQIVSASILFSIAYVFCASDFESLDDAMIENLLDFY